MKRLKTALVCMVGALAGGCTPVQWVKPDATPELLTRDLQYCEATAWQEAQFRSFAYPPFPWHPYGVRRGLRSPFQDRFFEEVRLRDYCMRAKGYRLEPLPE